MSLVVSKYLEAAVMAAVRPTVAISICSVLMMLSAVMIGFLELVGLEAVASDSLELILIVLSREVAP